MAGSPINPRFARRGQIVQQEDGSTEVIRSVDVILHMANGMDRVVPADDVESVIVVTDEIVSPPSS